MITFLNLLFSLFLLLITPKVSAASVKLDVNGTGDLTEVELPFAYYFRKQQGDKFTLIPVSHYKVYDLEEESDETAVVITLGDSIVIAVTDGKRLVVFNKLLNNNSEPDQEHSLEQIVRQNLDSNSPNSFLRARIYALRHDGAWQDVMLSTGINKSLNEAIDDVKKSLQDTGFFKENIYVDIWSFPVGSRQMPYYPAFYLGRYEFSQIYVAVRMKKVCRPLIDEAYNLNPIEFFSIDPEREDILNFRGTKINISEYLPLDSILHLEKEELLRFAEFGNVEITRDLLIPYEYIEDNNSNSKRFGYYDRKIRDYLKLLMNKCNLNLQSGQPFCQIELPLSVATPVIGKKKLKSFSLFISIENYAKSVLVPVSVGIAMGAIYKYKEFLDNRFRNLWGVLE